MQLPPDILSAKYALKCQDKNCGAEMIVTQNLGVGWKVGDIIPMDPSNPAYGRCNRCKSHNAMVMKVPAAQTLPGPKGFTKVPTE